MQVDLHRLHRLGRRASVLTFAGVLAVAPCVVSAAPAKPGRGRVQTDQQRAAELVQRAAERYRAGKYVEAAVLFREAYALSKLPTQLRNAAKAYADGGVLDDALAAWREYAEHPKLSPAERSEAEAQVALIEERRRTATALAEAEAAKRAAEEAESARKLAEAESARKLAEAESARISAEAERTAEEAEAAKRAAQGARDDGAAVNAEPRVAEPLAHVDVASSDDRAGASTGPWIVAGTGLVLGAVAGVLFGHASSRLSALDDKLAVQDGEGRVYGITRADAVDELDGINGERAWSVGLAVAAVGAIAGGLVWLALGSDEPGAASDVAHTGAAIVPLEDGAVIGWTGAW